MRLITLYALKLTSRLPFEKTTAIYTENRLFCVADCRKFSYIAYSHRGSRHAFNYALCSEINKQIAFRENDGVRGYSEFSRRVICEVNFGLERR